ncbi:MAG: amidohydrolase family protein [Sedimentisphaerales bacterium]|nr:amidohydrolase family protein [Sedimentisphaerales bacterium]
MEDRIIDFHAHAFPDVLAPRAMKVLLDEAPEARAYLDGTIADLLRSMDRAGIDKSVICCIATRPEQSEPILRWCTQIRSDRLIPFPSVHPADPACLDGIRRIREEGFLGIKLHPFYQNFFADEDRMLRFYEEVSRQGLLLTMHTGYDIAFPRIRRADPEKLRRIKEALPALKLITTHLGAWRQWDEVRQHLIGREIHMEISFGIDELGREQAREMILEHPSGCILFGTDSPWTDQSQTLSLLRNLNLSQERLAQILAGNALSLLGRT